MARVLIVEDEADIREVVAYNLTQAGHEVIAVGTGKEGLARVRAQPPDLVLLDLMLPDVAGTEVCRQIKQDTRTRDVPVVMVTAKGEEIDRVVGFELGADDYIVKPFSVRELMLRVQAVLRRSTRPAPAAAESFELGGLKVDRGAHRAWVKGEEVPLTALEFKLLVTLCERRGRVQTRERLLSDVWGIDADVTTRTVDTHVKRLREKLGSPTGDLIETVRGVGYRFSDEASPEGGA